MEDEVTDSWETGLQHADTDAVSAAGGRAPHAEDRVSEHLPSHRRELERTCSDTGKSGFSNRHRPPRPDFRGHPGTN